MKYIRVKNGIVVGIIRLDDKSLIPQFAAGFDHFMPIDAEFGGPHIGWIYNAKENIFNDPNGFDYVKLDLETGKKMLAVEASNPFVDPKYLEKFNAVHAKKE